MHKLKSLNYQLKYRILTPNLTWFSEVNNDKIFKCLMIYHTFRRQTNKWKLIILDIYAKLPAWYFNIRRPNNQSYKYSYQELRKGLPASTEMWYLSSIYRDKHVDLMRMDCLGFIEGQLQFTWLIFVSGKFSLYHPSLPRKKGGDISHHLSRMEIFIEVCKTLIGSLGKPRIDGN